MIRLQSLLTETVIDDPDYIAYIKDQEGAVKDTTGQHKAYKDVVGVWTIGYGHTGTDVKKGLKWPESKAELQLKRDLKKAETTVKQYVANKFSKTLNSTQLKMLTDFAFNLGSLSKFPKFVTAVVNKDWKAASKDYKRYAGGKELTKRNTDFYNKFLKPLLSAPKPVTKSNEPIDRIGQVIYPRKTSKHDYATIRMSPKVNNGLINNIIKTVKWPEKIGTVINSTIDDRWNTWYRVKLSNGQRGWVRYDVITSNKNEKFL